MPRISPALMGCQGGDKTPSPYSMGSTNTWGPKVDSGTVKVLHGQVDTLYWAFAVSAGDIEAVQPLLDEWKRCAVSSGDDAYRIPGGELIMRARGYGGRWPFVVVSPDVGEVQVAYAGCVPPVRCRMYSGYLSRVTVDEACRAAQSLVGEVLGQSVRVEGSQSSAIHVAVDFVGWAPLLLDYVGRRFVFPQKVDVDVVKSDPESGRIRSVRFGSQSSPIHAVIYDKVREIADQSPDKAYLLDKYRAAGWDGVCPVYRLEFRFNRKSLRKMGVELPVDVDAGALFRFGMSWLRFVDDPGGDSNRSRWPLAREWVEIADQVGGALADDGVVYDRSEVRAVPSVARLRVLMQGCARSVAATLDVSLLEAYQLVAKMDFDDLVASGVSADDEVARRRLRMMMR